MTAGALAAARHGASRSARPVDSAVERTRFPVIIGPTAGGKSALAVAIAQALRDGHGARAEIVTADSIQIYRGLDIGSAKPTEQERAGFPHHMIDVVEPTERFSVDGWLEGAERAIAEIQRRGGVPIVVGGTHLYIKALLEGLFEGPEPDEALRAELRAMEPGARRGELERVDPGAASRIHFNDARRTVRALEVYRLTGKPISAWQTQWDAGRSRPDCVLVGMEWPVEELNGRINARVKAMVERGLVEEARGLWKAGLLGPQAREALGYKQLAAHFDGGSTLEESIEEIKVETRRFAKNQRTWLRRLKALPGSRWVEMPAPDLEFLAQDVVASVVTRGEPGPSNGGTG